MKVGGTNNQSSVSNNPGRLNGAKQQIANEDSVGGIMKGVQDCLDESE